MTSAKRYLLILLCSFGNYSMVNAQLRHTDLKAVMQKPLAHTTIYSPTLLYFEFWLYNQGPDTIHPTDTLFYQPVYPYGNSEEKQRVVPFNRLLVSGDSMKLVDSVYINVSKSSTSFYLRFTVVAIGPKGNSSIGPLVNEYAQTMGDNTAKVILNHVGNSSSEINKEFENHSFVVSPNPSRDGVFSIIPNRCFGGCSLLVTNLLGERVYEIASLNKIDGYGVDLSGMKKGIYFFHFRDKKSVTTIKGLYL